MSRKNRKRKLGAEDRAVFEWEQDRILSEDLRDEMESMWEIPQIYHFLQLTKDAFNITHLSMYEVERMLLMPKASRQLAHIMTCLFSSPTLIKNKSQKIPPMPYKFWTNIMMYKLKCWFKVYHSKHRDAVKVLDTLGIEPEFWTIFPNAEDIEGKEFQDFSFKQRVWLLKTACDTAWHSRKTIQDEVTKQPWESQFETVLGIDRYGARYVYFPQFLHNDLRIYKHCIDNKVLSTVHAPIEKTKPKLDIVVKEESKACATPASRGLLSKKKRRKSRWSNGALPQKKRDKRRVDLDQLMVESNSNSVDSYFRSSRSSSKASEISNGSFAKSSSGYETNASVDANEGKCRISQSEEKNELEGTGVLEKEEVSESGYKSEEEPAAGGQLEKLSLSKTEDSPESRSNSLGMDDLSKSSKTDDEKLEEMSSLSVSKTVEKCPDSSETTKDVNSSKSDDEKLFESKIEEPITDGESKDLDNEKKDNASLNSENDSDSGARRSARIKHISEIKLEVEDAENMVDVCDSEELSSQDMRDSLCRVSSPEDNYLNGEFNEDEWKVDDFNTMLNDLSASNFQLVADSLESLKDLTEYIATDKTVPGLEIRREDYVRPTCELKLLQRMQKLCNSLENVKDILKESMKKARAKLQREWISFEHGSAEEDQDARDEESGANRWLIGPQGLPGTSACSISLSSASLSGAVHCSYGQQGDSEHQQGADSVETTTSSSGIALLGQQQIDPFEGHGSSSTGTTDTEGYKRGCGDQEGQETSGKVKRETTEEGEDVEKGPREENQRPKRVLRARGVSSYTEQLFSDDSGPENELEGWADIEAIYASPSKPDGTSSPNTLAKSQDSCNESSQEDSDQDWILPSSRKRKHKRPSASRRLKSFQHKIQNIKVDENGELLQPSPSKSSKSPGSGGSLANAVKRPPPDLIPKFPQISETKSAANVAGKTSKATASAEEEPVKLESQDAGMHSVLDIKDEGPVYDSTTISQTNIVNNTNCVQQNYVVVTTGHAPVGNYYVMQQNPPSSAVIQPNQYIQQTAFVPQMIAQPQIPQMSTTGYLVQSNQQNYVVQSPAGTGLVATQTRQAFIAPTNASMMYQSQQPVLQYVAAPMQQQQHQQHMVPQPRIINTMTLTPPRQIGYVPRAQIGGNRMPIPAGQPNFPHPNGAVIRSAPIASTVLRPGQRVASTRPPPPRRQVCTPR
ncbi:hypothetical protein QAD02_022681 [Eretmocerus hayati]|uniref:Uncharacterized protein n=1 Tax=Eretmocerus hayati TaxID=131215 RepID=A0ACC2PTX6_9HYME|nr:hypothetical protein QAD02_022681 [Eretmocerus hayati]